MTWLLLGTLLLFFSPVLVRGWVVFPHDNSIEVGLPQASTGAGERPSQRKFSDQSSAFVPELSLHLRDESSGWLATWNPHVQLGRPAGHLGGISKAYAPLHLLSWFSDDPLRVYSLLVVLTLIATAWFSYRLLTDLDLHPSACLVGALGLGLSPFLCYWLTFLTFLSTVCFTVALLWLVPRFLRTGGLGTAWGIVGTAHLLLLSGYPQFLVLQCYLLAAATLATFFQLPRRLRVRRGLGLLVLGGLAAISVFPVWADVVLAFGDSLRQEVDSQFFLSALPQPSADEGLAYAASLLDFSWQGNPMEVTPPRWWQGFQLNPVVAALLFLSLSAWRRSWPWLLFVALCLLPILVPATFAFAVQNLGFHLSRSSPIGGILIPAVIAAAMGADALLKGECNGRGRGLLLLLMPLALVGSAALKAGNSVRLPAVFCSLALTAALVTSWWLGRGWPLVLASLVAAIVHSFPLALWRPVEEVKQTSALLDCLQRESQPRDRYLRRTDLRKEILPANQEIWHELRSVQSYDSLAPLRYVEWTRPFSALADATRGRHFRGIDADRSLDPERLAWAGVGLVVSAKPLPEGAGQPLQEVSGLHLTRSALPPVHHALLRESEVQLDGDRVTLVDRSLPAARAVLQRMDLASDHLHFEFAPSSDSSPRVLFLSQQFHPSWQARSGPDLLQTVGIDGFYQGVLVPPDVGSVELRFRPWARFAWLPQAALAVAAFACFRPRKKTCASPKAAES
jgi:hypothetical protein